MLVAQTLESRGATARKLEAPLKIASAFLATVAFLSLSANASQTPSAVPVPHGVAHVEHALAAHDYTGALRITQAELQAHPGDLRLWTLRGMAYAGARKPVLAVTAYRHALKLSPEFLPALEGAAQIEYQQDAPDAEALLQRVLALQPADPTTHAMLAALEYKSGECKEATVHFQQAEPVIRTQFAALSEFGVCLSKLDRLDEAIPVLQQALVLDTGSHVARYNLALVLWKAKNDEEALHVLEPELQVNTVNSIGPENQESLMLAAEISETRNDTPRAVALLRRTIVLNPHNIQAYLSFATLSNDHASYQVGIDMLNLGLGQLPRAAQLYSARGVLYAQLGNLSKAMDDFETANLIDPRFSFAGVAEGITQTQNHDYVHALAKFREESRLRPDDAFNQYLLAETLAQHGAAPGSPEYEEELRAATRAVQLDPHLALAQNLLSSFYLQTGKTVLAIEHCEAVLRVDPTNQEALYHMILALRTTDRKDEIPALTKRLVALRTAEDDRKSHIVRYQLVENAPIPSSTSTGPN